MSDPEFSQLLTSLYRAVRLSRLHATQCGLLIFSSSSILSSPLASPILAISPYPLPVTAQPDDPTNPTSLSLAHTAFTQDSGSSPAPGMVYQLVPIEDLEEEEEEEVEDSEIEEDLAIEIAALDPAPAYSA